MCKGEKECKFKVSKGMFSEGDNFEPAVKDSKVNLCEDDDQIDKKLFKLNTVITCKCDPKWVDNHKVID